MRNKTIKLRALLPGICLVFSLSQCFAQSNSNNDTLILLNGKTAVVSVIDTSGDLIKYQTVSKKTKQRMVEKERVFSIHYANGTSKTVYEQDSLSGNLLSVEEMGFFIKGEQDASKGYRAPLTTITGFVIGAGCPLAGLQVLSFIPPFAYGTVLVNLNKIRIKPETVSKKEYLEHDVYVMGYERVARSKRIFNGLRGGAIGLAVGFTIYELVNKNK